MIFLKSKGLSRVIQQHCSKPSILWHSALFMVQLSHPYMTTGKTIALTRWTFVSKVMSLLFTMLSRFDMCVWAKSFQSCPTLCDPTDYSPPVFSVHGILQARILEWVAMPRDLLDPGIERMSFTFPALAGRFFTTSAIWEAWEGLS